MTGDAQDQQGVHPDERAAATPRPSPLGEAAEEQGGWIVINTGGGPTSDKPDVRLEPPRDPSLVDGFMTSASGTSTPCIAIRAHVARGSSPSRGTTMGAELRCYLRDPDGYLIEVGQTLA